MKEFHYRGWKLFDAIDALLAYDGGAVDSGVCDEQMKSAVADYFASLDQSEFRIACARYARNLLTDESLAQGYGLDDVRNFVEWISGIGLEARS